jgi:hypothetical protein
MLNERSITACFAGEINIVSVLMQNVMEVIFINYSSTHEITMRGTFIAICNDSFETINATSLLTARPYTTSLT